MRECQPVQEAFLKQEKCAGDQRNQAECRGNPVGKSRRPGSVRGEERIRTAPENSAVHHNDSDKDQRSCNRHAVRQFQKQKESGRKKEKSAVGMNLTAWRFLFVHDPETVEYGKESERGDESECIG